MKFTVARTSGEKPNVGETECKRDKYGLWSGTIELETLGDLLELMCKYNTRIVMSMSGDGPSIEIYDSYRE